MKIKVLNATLESYWYSNHIGYTFTVKYNILDRENSYMHHAMGNYFRNADVVITELPESFCVKRCYDEEKWEKYIDWLREKYERNLDGYINKYYGARDSYTFGKDVIFGTVIHIDDMIKHIDYMEQRMKDQEPLIVKEETTTETQKLSRQGLKEIHGVACSAWKETLKKYGSRNPLEDYIELTQEEVQTMFNASDEKQKTVLSKYLKQDDLLDFNKVSGSIQTPNGQEFIGKRVLGMFQNKSFYLHKGYDWEIKEDNLGELCLIPTKKK